MNVITLGTFDLFHRGHVELLRRCRWLAEGGAVRVGLNTDEFVERYKGRRPVVSYADRRAVLEACRFVDDVVENPQSARPRSGASASVLDVLPPAPSLIVVGSDWQTRDYLGQLEVSQAELDRFGARVCYVPYTEGISSTDIRDRMAVA